MPNYLAHSYMTSEVLGPDIPDLTIASMLPEFRKIYLAKPSAARRSGQIVLNGFSDMVTAGLAFHDRMEDIFDENPRVEKTREMLAKDLRSEHIGAAVSILAASMAVDLLTDRALLDVDSAVEQYQDLGGAVEEGDTVLDAEEFDRGFGDFTKRKISGGAPKGLSDPRVLAKKIQIELDAKASDPRHRIGHDSVGKLTDILFWHAEGVGRVGVGAVEAAIKTMRGQPKKSKKSHRSAV